MFKLIRYLKDGLRSDEKIEIRLFDELICNIRLNDEISCYNNVLWIKRKNGDTLIPLDQILMVRRRNNDDLL